MIGIGVVHIGQDGIIHLWNQWMARRSGIAAPSALGKQLADLFPEIAGSRLDNAIAAALHQRMSSIVSPGLNDTLIRLYETPLDRAADQPMKLNITVYPLSPRDEADGCLMQIADVTAAFRRETLLRERLSALKSAQDKLDSQARELAEINQELEQFAYVASHDLRQPLRTIIGLLKNIKAGVLDTLSDTAKGHFDLVTSGAARMDRMIVSLLEYSRSGHSTLHEPVPVGQTVQDALTHLAVAIAKADATVSVEGDAALAVVGDASALSRVFQNLIGNSVKYRAPERRLELHIGWRRQDADVLIWVRDNGMGIAPENHDRAFMIFQRMVAADAFEGTGIGLAVVKKIIERGGGHIWIESDLDEGCAFFITLPSA
jgi:signal transduction histidine kinase